MKKKVKNSCIFRAKIPKGFLIKTIFDMIEKNIKRIFIVIDKKEGIIIREVNNQNTIMFDILLKRENIEDFVCEEDMITISSTASHIFELLKPTRKKDSVTLSIESFESKMLNISISQENSDKTIQVMNSVTINFEENYEKLELPAKEEDYMNPYAVNNKDLSKLKNILHPDRDISVKIQGNEHISFKCDSGNIYCSQLLMGKFTKKSSFYEAMFKVKTFAIVIKLATLSGVINFYQPPEEKKLPLKVSANICGANYNLGKITIYFKDTEQIAYERTLRKEQETSMVISSVKNKKMKKIK